MIEYISFYRFAIQYYFPPYQTETCTNGMICSLLESKSQVRFNYVYGLAVVVRPFKLSNNTSLKSVWSIVISNMVKSGNFGHQVNSDTHLQTV